MKNNPIICIILIGAWLLGTIGGFGYLCYYHQYPIAVAVGIVGAIAAPAVIKYIKDTQRSL